ncbi:MAG TPA: phosphoenolpyruvate-utilizing N-terminal domain-containing protein, partial [Polyangiaceae bacterium]|nr:phosphoenolpyruvate-utilizing N-terminal domain-containing protein [Polyangiaceae bacterium]
MKRRTISSEIPAVGTGEVLMGIAGSHGVAVAPAVVVGSSRVGYPRRRLKAGEADHEWTRYGEAVRAVQADLRRIIEGIEAGKPEASILEAYLLMMGDETLAARVRTQLYDQDRCADWAVAEATDELSEQLG